MYGLRRSLVLLKTPWKPVALLERSSTSPSASAWAIACAAERGIADEEKFACERSRLHV